MLWSKANLCTRPLGGQMLALEKDCPVRVFCVAMEYFAFWVGKGEIFLHAKLLGTTHKSRARNISLHTPSILHRLSVRSHFPATTMRGWLWWWRQNYAACLLLGVASVEPQKCPNVNLWNRPIFQQLGFPNKRLWQLSRRRFCPFLLILACWVFHPTRDSDIYTKLSFSFWHINTVFAVVVVH